MQTADCHKQLYLVRARPGSVNAARALGQVRAALENPQSAVVVFFHGKGTLHAAVGPGCEWATLAAAGRVSLQVCNAAWQRRQGDGIPQPFVASSLVQFWHLAAALESVQCFGASSDR